MNPGAVAVIPNGVEGSSFSVTSAKQHRLLYLGRLEIAQKGLDLLLEAYASVADRVGAPLVIAGDGPDRRAIEELINRLGIHDRVELLGRVTGQAKLDLLASSQLLCIPSRYESFGMVAVEALACGTPVLAFEIPCLREVVPEGAGRLIAPGDVGAYAAALVALAADPDGCREMARRGRSFARRFDWDAIAAEQEDVYRLATTRASTMTVPSTRGEPDPQPTRVAARHSGTLGARAWFWTATMALAAGAVWFRAFRINRSYDVYVDEISYIRIGHNVARHLSVSLYGKPFFLHPPAYFFIEAAVMQVVRLPGDVLKQVAVMRDLNIALAAITAVLLVALVRPVAGRWAALACGGLFAIDPFIIRQNDRVLLETNALLWVVAGYAVLLPLTGATSSPRRAMFRAIGGGGLLGIGLLSNDVTALLTLLPLMACFAIGWAMPRRHLLAAAATVCLVYLPYPLIVAATGNWATFFNQKGRGLLRLAGAVQETGFNRPNSLPLSTKLMQDIGQFAPTYGLIAVGAVACVVLARSRSRPHQLLAAWAASGFVFLGYCAVFGTIEEQMFYYLVLPAIVVTVVAGEYLLRTTRGSSRHRPAATAIALVAAIFIAATAVPYARVHTTTDDGYVQLVAYLDAHVPSRATIVVSPATATANFVLDRFSAETWTTVAQLVQYHAQYVVVSTKAVTQGYGDAEPAMVPWLRAHGQPIWEYRGDSVGDLVLYRLPPNL
jgi:hypothetical protein